MAAIPHTAMVLAAGLGTRMRPLTEATPKPLIEVAGTRLIDRVLAPMKAAGVRRLIVNVHWLGEQVEAWASDQAGLDIVISDERERVLETGGALAKARPLLGEDPLLVVNTDAFWVPADRAPLDALAGAWDPDIMDECLLLADRERCLGFAGAGDFTRAADGCLARRGEAPSAPWAYAGVRILKPALYDDEPAEPFSANRVWDRLLPGGRIHGVALDRFWLHVGDPAALADASMWLTCHGA